MKYKVLRKQYNAAHCFVCGLQNDHGLHAAFYETDNNELVALIEPSEKHQSYPGRMHGGVSAAILDETIGRAISIGNDDNIWGVTIELTTKFRKPVPYDKPLIIVGRITKNGSRVFEGTGEIILENGDIAVSAEGRYIKVPLDKITDTPMDTTDWHLTELKDDPNEIEIPGR